jgi:hypothetical protein
MLHNNPSTSPHRDTPGSGRILYSDHSPRTALSKSVEDPDKRLLFKNFVSKPPAQYSSTIDFDENWFDLDEYE